MQTAGIAPRGVIVAVDRAFDRAFDRDRIGPKPPPGAPPCPYRHANAETGREGAGWRNAAKVGHWPALGIPAWSRRGCRTSQPRARLVSSALDADKRHIELRRMQP